MVTTIYLSTAFSPNKKIVSHSVHPHSLLAGEREDGGLNLLPNFQKRGRGGEGGEALQDLDFQRGLLGNRRVTFFSGDCRFYIKNKVKSEIFHNEISL